MFAVFKLSLATLKKNGRGEINEMQIFKANNIMVEIASLTIFFSTSMIGRILYKGKFVCKNTHGEILYKKLGFSLLPWPGLSTSYALE